VSRKTEHLLATSGLTVAPPGRSRALTSHLPLVAVAHMQCERRSDLKTTDRSDEESSSSQRNSSSNSSSNNNSRSGDDNDEHHSSEHDENQSNDGEDDNKSTTSSDSNVKHPRATTYMAQRQAMQSRANPIDNPVTKVGKAKIPLLKLKLLSMLQ
jgi:TATA-binding protein-associated factor Taf7